jgi:hypothetical protein
MWKPVILPYIFERMIGFAVTNERVVIVSYEGIHSINLVSPTHEVIHDSDHPEGGEFYNHAQNILTYQNLDYSLYGLHGGNPKNAGRFGERLVLNQQEELLIFNAANEELFKFKYQDLSGDWAFATFTPDDKFVVLGLPYDIYVFERI